MTDASASDLTPAVPQPPEPDVSDPAKLIRLGTMLQVLLAEVGDATKDASGRQRLAAIHQETISELSEILSEDLREELLEFNACVGCDEPTEGEIRVAQAQLVGWMQGLLRGMQASAQAQAAIAQRQLAQVRMGGQPGMPQGMPVRQQPAPQGAAPQGAEQLDDAPGYL